MTTNILSSRIDGFMGKAVEAERFSTVPKIYDDGLVEFELDISGTNIDAIDKIVEGIYLLNRYSADEAESNGNVDILMNFFGIGFMSSFAEKCVFCHKFEKIYTWPAHFIVKRNHRMRTIKGEVSQCGAKKCDYMYVNAEQMMTLLDGIREQFNL